MFPADLFGAEAGKLLDIAAQVRLIIEAEGVRHFGQRSAAPASDQPQRGLNALSDSGAGFEATMEMPLLDEIGLIRPGLVVSIAGIKGISRSCRIHAAWDASKGLVVTQTVGLERREVET